MLEIKKYEIDGFPYLDIVVEDKKYVFSKDYEKDIVLTGVFDKDSGQRKRLKCSEDIWQTAYKWFVPN